MGPSGPTLEGAAGSGRGPRLGTTVMVAHALGSEAVPADLEEAGFEVMVATVGPQALEAVRDGRADIALVDGRFDGDGLLWCERMWAERPGYPVLIMGPDDENLVARALSAGADDYLQLPLRPAELVARVRAVLRRAPRGFTGRDEAGRAIQVGEICLSVESHEVHLRSSRIHLALREFELLHLLMENAGIVLPRTTLIARLWGPGADLHSTSLEVHIRRLRAKLEDDPGNPQRILTVRGIGYRYQGE